MSYSVIDLDDNSTVCSGTYTLGNAASTIKTVIDAGMGASITVTGGPLPANGIIVHLNRGRASTRYDFRATSFSLTGGADPFGIVAPCCVVGG
jgi:hypothetical protein